MRLLQVINLARDYLGLGVIGLIFIGIIYILFFRKSDSTSYDFSTIFM